MRQIPFETDNIMLPFTWCILMLLLIVVMQQPITMLLILVALLMTSSFVFGCRQAFNMFKSNFLFIIIITVVNPLFIHSGNIVLFRFFNVSFYLENFINGTTMAEMLVSINLLLNLFVSFRAPHSSTSNYLMKFPSLYLLVQSVTLFFSEIIERGKESIAIQKVNISGKSNLSIYLGASTSVLFTTLKSAVRRSDTCRLYGWSKDQKPSVALVRPSIEDCLKALLTITICGATLIYFQADTSLYALDFTSYPTLSLECYLSLMAFLLLLVFSLIESEIRWKVVTQYDFAASSQFTVQTHSAASVQLAVQTHATEIRQSAAQDDALRPRREQK